VEAAAAAVGAAEAEVAAATRRLRSPRPGRGRRRAGFGGRSSSAAPQRKNRGRRTIIGAAAAAQDADIAGYCKIGADPPGGGDEPSRGLRRSPLVHLIEILLPLSDNDGKRFGPDLHAKVRDELIEHFGGVTAFNRSPAEGLWKEGAGEPDRDEIVIYEVMADWLDRGWWRGYRETLEKRFRQDEIVVRAREVELL
jgi:hypothetical protein